MRGGGADRRSCISACTDRRLYNCPPLCVIDTAVPVGSLQSPSNSMEKDSMEFGIIDIPQRGRTRPKGLHGEMLVKLV